MEEDIAERLREENPEQFLILVRMHLSFLIDMNTDENDSPNDKPKPFKWGFSKKFKTNSNSTSEATSKSCVGPPKPQTTVPITDDTIKQIYQLIDILSLESSLVQEGIFRRTGSLSRQQQLKRLLASGGILDEDTSASYSAHDMASVLKGILADTPEPLLLNQHHQAYCHLAATCFADGVPYPSSEAKLIDAIRLLLLLLPASIRQMMKRLLALLNKTASYESSNRMSPSALATMFTPHVVCPRRLSPESLHSDSQSLSPIVCFMIKKASTLFVTPPQLATDVAAYLAKKQHQRLLSPNGEDLNESVTERTAASTVFTFVDRQMSGVDVKDGGATDAALAQLYAYIQSLPESHNKRRLIKQFNRENGHGTPLQLQRAQKQKSLGKELKNRIFARSLMSKTGKKPVNLDEQRFGYHPIIENQAALKSKLKQSSSDMSLNDTRPLMLSNLSLKQSSALKNVPVDTPKSGKQSQDENKNNKDDTDEELDVFCNSADDNLDDASFSCDESNTPLKKVERLTPKYTSEPNLSFLPSNHEGTPKYTKSKGSKLFKSKASVQPNISLKKDVKKTEVQRLQKAKRLSMDDKNVKDTSEHSLTFKSCMKCTTESFSEADYTLHESKPSISHDASSPRLETTPRLVKKDSVKCMRQKRNLSNRSDLSNKTATPESGEDGNIQPMNNICEPNTPTISLMKPNYLTSTPAVILTSDRNYDNCSTPMFSGAHILRRGSMSPITKSTQKMPKAMQESIMTPRSRKPVIISCEAATTTMLPCPPHVTTHHPPSNNPSDSSNADTVYDTTPSSMNNDSDFVSTDESCPSSSYIQYKHIDDKDSSKNKSHASSVEHFPHISDSVILERRLRSIQERKYQKLLEKKAHTGSLFYTDQSRTSLLGDHDGDESDLDSSPNTKPIIDKNASLTGPFREYLLNRSVLTGSPVDLSFTSGPEDYYNSKTDILDNISEGKMTESLLYCMNGNVPADLTINSDFDNSDTVPLLKSAHKVGNSVVNKFNLTIESSTDDSTSKKIRKLLKNDNTVVSCDTKLLNKENVSPGSKRPAYNICSGVDQEAVETKKVNVAVEDHSVKPDGKSSTLGAAIQGDPDYWDYNRYGPLWETNL